MMIEETVANKPSKIALWFFLVLGGVVVATVLYSLQFEPQEIPKPVTPIYDQERTISYSLMLKNESLSLLRDAEMFVYGPVTQLSSQRCCDQMESSHPYELVSDSLGNQALKFQFEVLPPYGQQTVQIKSTVKLASEPNQIPLENLSPYLQAAPFIEVVDSKIDQHAQALTKSSEIETARAIGNHVMAP